MAYIGFYETIWYDNYCAKNINGDTMWYFCEGKYQNQDMTFFIREISKSRWYDIFVKGIIKNETIWYFWEGNYQKRDDMIILRR